MADDRQQSASAAWDRVGQMLQDAGTLGQRVLQRNLDMWNGVSENLRSADQYTSDQMAADTAKVVLTAQNNLDEMWSYATQPPARERFAYSLPTAFLFFERPSDKNGRHSLVDGVFISVPQERDRVYPEKAEIALEGTSWDAKTESKIGVDALMARLDARRSGPRVYRLESVDIANQEPKRDLVPGVYDGLVYLTSPPMPLANVRVIVEGPPPEA